jgi:DNA polymerase III subunit epsilon
MRQIILDTETTGLDPTQGHRIIEIAGVEIHNRRLTGNHFHRYVNPERASDDAALQVHGLTAEFLADKPKFREVADELLDFVSGAELVIHNAAFDIAFLDYELKLLGRHAICTCCPSVVDSLKLAKDMYPGKRNGLDALCDRYEINRTARSLHGALLDARLLAEVYLAMTRGQESLVIDVEAVEIKVTAVNSRPLTGGLKVLEATQDEEELHLTYLADLDKVSRGACLWAQYAAAQQPSGVPA